MDSHVHLVSAGLETPSPVVVWILGHDLTMGGLDV